MTTDHSSNATEQSGSWRLLLADDHSMLLEALADRLQNLDPTLTVAPARDLSEALVLLKEGQPCTMALLDYHMPGMEGAKTVKLMRQQFPDLPVGIISGFVSQEDAQELIAAGAIGVFPKKMSGSSLLIALKLAMTGQIYMPWGGDLTPLNMRAADKQILESDLIPDLTERQRDVLNYVLAGAPNKEIALQLNLSEITIKVHVAALCRKFAVSNRTQLAMAASRAAAR